MRDLYIKNGQGFVVVYSITSLQTFYDIKTMKEQILRVKGRNKIPIILVGNKSDLEEQREVHSNDGAGLAHSWECPFLEASAKSTQSVNEVFIEIVREMTTSPSRNRGCCNIL